ncbi:MAG: DivIVA domain-containing protein [Ruminococcus sp.]|nr:DivIVA domain-containing protein [Ruminococcus sp.]
MITSDSIRKKSFETVKNGYDIDAVKAFLAEVAQEVAELNKKNEENEDKIIKLVDKINEYREDEEAIKNALVLSQKESNKIINDAKAQARDMIESAKSEQVRLSEQSASECEKIIREHKENCARLIKENTEVTQQKIQQVRADYDKEKADYENLQREVAIFKANLTSLYQQQIALIMQIPDTVVDDDGDDSDEEYEIIEEVKAEDEPAAPALEETAPEAAVEEQETEQEHIDKILNTGSFEPVIPKENLQDLKFGKNN